MNEDAQVRRWTVDGASNRGVLRPDGRLQVRLPEDCPAAWQALAELDNAVRADIPGTDGWLGTAADLQATLADPEFVPELYVIAQHTASGSLDGLIRVWNRRPHPRLGCWGVRRPWRRTSLAPALVAVVATTLRTRGSTRVITETDETNVASSLAAANHGGIRTGTLVEWERPL